MIWTKWPEHWQAAIDACRAKPGTPTRESANKPIPRFQVDPPATDGEVEAVEREFERPLPRSFREVLTEFSKHVDVAWQLPRELKPPGPLRAIFGGGLGWDLARLGEIDDGRYDMMDAAFDDPSDPYSAVWHDKLAFWPVPNGDYLALDLASTERTPVVYLSHDGGSGHAYELGEDFIDFVDRYTRLGCPGPEDWQWLPFTSGRKALLDPDCENAVRWREWFGLPANWPDR